MTGFLDSRQPNESDPARPWFPFPESAIGFFRPRYWAARRILLASVLFFATLSLGLSEKLFLPFESAAPGSNVVIPVTLVSQTGSISAIQFDLQFDDTVMSLVASVGEATRNSGKRLYSADLAPNKRRFLILGLNRNSISSGSLVDLFVSLKPTAPNGLYPLALSQALGVTPTGQPEALTAVDDGALQVLGNLGDGPRLLPTGILSGASFLPGPVSPGEVLTLLGAAIGPALAEQPAGSPTSTALGGTRVLFDGTPAPLLYAGTNQINLIVPFGVSGKLATRMEVTSGDAVIADLPLPVVEWMPALFTQDSTGTGPGAILNADSTLNSPSNPAPPESVVVLFGSGAGQTDPPTQDGQINGAVSRRRSAQVSVLIGGVEAEILYAGDAPGQVAGIVQINCRIPPGVAPAFDVPVVLRIGTSSSQAGVTLAIQ